MGEILQINFGQCGNDIRQRYLEKLIFDHQLEKSKAHQPNKELINQKLKNSFDEIDNDQLLYRGAFVEFDSKSIDKILSSSSSNFIDPNLLIFKKCSNSSGTFHSSSNIYKNEMNNDFEDAIRKQVEKCSHLDNINYIYPTYDKYCGFASEGIKYLADRYPNLIHSNNTIMPSWKCFNPIEIYNAVFSIHYQIQFNSFTLVYDYDALEKTTETMQQGSNFANYNDIIAETILQSNCSSRFPGFHNSDIRKMSTNLICFPRLHFLTCSFGVIQPKEDLFEQFWKLSSLQNSYFTYPQEFENQYLSQVIITRSLDKYFEINQFNEKMQNQNPWIKDGFQHVNCKVQHRYFGDTAMHIGNHRYFAQTLKPIQDAFSVSFQRKAFLHYYTQQGADDMEFTEAECNLDDLISEYCEYNGPTQPDYYCEEEEEY